MICRNCGSQLNKDDLFCAVCGSAVASQSGSLPRRRKKTGDIILIVLIIAAALVAFAVIALVVSQRVGGGNADEESESFDTPILSDESVPDPEPAEEKDQNNSIEIGSHVFWGEYEVDGNENNGTEQVEWIVLDKTDDAVLLISAYCLDCGQYNTDSSSVTWQQSPLRQWLNTDFIQSLFVREERDCILTTTLANDNNPQYGTSGGDVTYDKIFLLSLDEANLYFSSNSERQARGTDYAIENGIYVNKFANGSTSNQHIDGSGYGYSWWWLRSPGETTAMAACIVSDGNFNYKGSSAASSDGGIRPVLWAEISALPIQ